MIRPHVLIIGTILGIVAASSLWLHASPEPAADGTVAGARDATAQPSVRTNENTTDTIKPTISEVRATAITVSDATISWSTSEAGTSHVRFGVSPRSYTGMTAPMVSDDTRHQVTLTGLAEGTTYYVHVQSTDRAGNTGNSAEISFTTLARSR